jgi:hypothetical protein
MVKLTVLLIRCAETEEDCLSPGEIVRLKDPTVNAELKAYINNQAADESGIVDGKRSLSARVDPPLTKAGYEQAQNGMTYLLDAISAGNPQRKVALFSAPNKSCAASAVMMSCADISKRESLTWALTTLETAKAPMAVPIVVSNGLCNSDPDVNKLGGYRAAMDAGIMHCAGLAYNDTRTKCPLMKGE